MSRLTLRVPKAILADLEERAKESGRSLDAEVIEILERERTDRAQDKEFQRKLAELNELNRRVEMSDAEWQALWDEMREERDNRPPLDSF